MERIQDALNTEFLYYGSMLKLIAPTLSNIVDKEFVTKWIQKLFAPEYQTTKLREKRNRYLASLVTTILNDEMLGVFKHSPPDGALMEVESLEPETTPAADWETDKMWQETLLELPDDFKPLKCSIHDERLQCKQDHILDTILDQEFQLLLYISRPYAALLQPRDRTKAAAWIQMLSSIHGEACSSMRGLRNDYMMALLGYLNDLRLVGPFNRVPPSDTLVNLSEALKKDGPNPITDPCGADVEEFLSIQPLPEDGAFCYIALTGDLISSNFGPNL